MLGKKTEMELRRKTEISDGMGGITTSWAGLRKIKGTLSTIRGDERLSSDKLTVIASHNFYIDFPIGLTITAKDIFVKGTTEYKIIYPNNMGNMQGKKLRITLKEEE
jgi:head-tail adaptor